MQTSYAQAYAGLYRRHWWWRARERLVLATLRGIGLSADARILDVGCGDGLFWPELRKFGVVEGIEPDGRLVSADNPDRERIEVSGFLSGRQREPYDLLTMLDVLEHIEDEHAAVARIKDLLVEGGQIVLTVPAFQCLWSYHDELNGHYRRYTAGRLRRVLTAAGLEVVRVRYFFFWMLLPMFIRKLVFRKAPEDSSAFTSVPASPINWLLEKVSNVDCGLSRAIPWPAGGSILAVARKPRGTS